MNFLEKLEKNKANFSKNEIEICQKIEMNLRIVVNNSISFVAISLETSTAAITRFVHKAGFQNYREFRTECIKYCGSTIINTDGYDGDATISENITEVYRKSLSYVSQFVKEEQIVSMIQLLHKHKHIRAFGGYRSSLPATMLKYELAFLNKHIEQISYESVKFDLGSLFTGDDLLILFSSTLKTTYPSKLIKEAHEAGSDVIVITMTPDVEIQKLATLFIQLPCAKKQDTNLLLDDTVMFMVLVNIIMNYYANEME